MFHLYNLIFHIMWNITIYLHIHGGGRDSLSLCQSTIFSEFLLCSRYYEIVDWITSPKKICPRANAPYLWILPFLKRVFGNEVIPNKYNASDWYSLEESRNLDPKTYRGHAIDDGGRDCSDASTNQGRPRTASNHWKLWRDK